MSNSPKPSRVLSYDQVYTCPVCHHGEMANLSLMDAFACNFCHHIFTADLEQQIIEMADSQLILKWRWNGRSWQGIRQNELKITVGYWMASIAFVLLPTLIVSLAAYFFPPLPGSPLSWFPLAWVALTFFSHLTCLIWLVIEYYQFPLFRYLRAVNNQLFTHFRS